MLNKISRAERSRPPNSKLMKAIALAMSVTAFIPQTLVASPETAPEKNRIIVKLKTDPLVASVEGPAFGNEMDDRLSRLDPRLNTRNVKKLFSYLNETNIESIASKNYKSRDRIKKRLQSLKQKFVNTYVVETGAGDDLQEVLTSYRANPEVEYAQIDYLVETVAIPNDPLYDNLYGLEQMSAAQAWDTSEGEGVVVAVVDSGVDIDHPDLTNNIWINEDEIPDNGIDDDNNGYVDDVYGWNFVENNNDVMDQSNSSHGTHVAGTIAAEGNNKLGIIGVAPKATIMPLRAVGETASYTSQMADAIVYAAANGADVINNSWACVNRLCASNPIAEEAVRTAIDLGSVVVFAAGNETMDVASLSPQNMAETITVSATTSSSERASFSNFGGGIDVAAPGQSILSTIAGGDGDTSYGSLSGTSMACPHVSGAVALLLAHNPGLEAAEVQQIIRQSVNDRGEAGFDIDFGYGEVDLSKLFESDYLDWSVTLHYEDVLSISYDASIADIMGSVSSDDFESYTVSYRNLVDDQGWQSINGTYTSEVTDSLVASWDATNIASGPYLIRVIVNNANGDSHELVQSTYLMRNPEGTGFIPAYGNVINYFDMTATSITWADFNFGMSFETRGLHTYSLDSQMIEDFSFFQNPPELATQVEIEGDHVVWAGMSLEAMMQGMPPSLYYRDTVSGATEQLFPFDFFVMPGEMVGTQLSVWRMADDFMSFNLHLYDVESQQSTVLVNRPTMPSTTTAFDGRYVAWIEEMTSSGELYLLDSETGSLQLVATDVGYVTPNIMDGRLTWVSETGAVNLYDVATGSVTVIDSGAMIVSEINSQLVVYLKPVSESMATIYGYHIPSGVILPLGQMGLGETFGGGMLLRLEGDLLVWTDARYIINGELAGLSYSFIDMDRFPKLPEITNLVDYGYVALEWSYDDEAPDHYTIEWSSDSSFTTVDGSNDVHYGLQFAKLFEEFSTGTHYFRVAACDENQVCGPWSEVASLDYVDFESVAAPMIDSVETGGRSWFKYADVNWSLAEGTEYPIHVYKVEVANDAAMANAVTLVSPLTHIRLFKLLLGSGDNKFVRVSACNYSGCTAWSNVAAFSF